MKMEIEYASENWLKFLRGETTTYSTTTETKLAQPTTTFKLAPNKSRGEDEKKKELSITSLILRMTALVYAGQG